jgi:hypothetical protein
MQNNLFKLDSMVLDASEEGSVPSPGGVSQCTFHRITEAMSEPTAFLNRLPHERTAVRKPSSLRLDHFERRNKAPCHPVRTRTKNSPVITH